MDTGKDADSTRGEGEAADEQRGTYTYVCPICGARKTGLLRESSPNDRALSALESHVRQRDGGEHGPQYELPEGVDRASLSTCIETSE